MDICIKNGTIVNAHDIIKADIGIQNGKITKIGQDLSGLENIDASGKYIFPGLIEVNSRLEMPFASTRSIDNFYSGTKAATGGGITTIIDLFLPSSGESLQEALKKRRQLADPQVVIDYGLHAYLPQIKESILAEIPQIIKAGVSSFEISLYGPEISVSHTDSQLFSLLQELSQTSGILAVNSGNYEVMQYISEHYKLDEFPESIQHYPEICPPIAEAQGIQRMMTLAMLVHANLYIPNLSCEAALKQIFSDYNTHTRIYTQTALHYLTHTLDAYRTPDARQYSVVPPLREKQDLRCLWKGIQSGAIQIVGTSHQAFTREQKKLGQRLSRIPTGFANLELLLPILYHKGIGQKHIDLMQLVSVVSANPAQIFGLQNKGAIVPGKDADLVIFDPLQKHVISSSNLQSNSDFCIYDGLEVHGWPEMTMSRGKIVFDHHKFTGEQGAGQFISRTI